MWFYDLIAERARAGNEKRLGGDPVQACVQESQIHVATAKGGGPNEPEGESQPLKQATHPFRSR
jgi:hypothetical protein